MLVDPNAPALVPPAVATLADLRDGESARVTQIASPALRAVFSDLGLEEGVEVHVRHTGRWCVIDAARGIVPLEVVAARTVQVDRPTHRPPGVPGDRAAPDAPAP